MQPCYVIINNNLIIMSEQITATSVLDPGNRINLDIITATPLEIGTGTVKHCLETTLGGDQPTTTIPLIERNFDPSYIDAWIAFREAGIAVTPTLHLSSRNTLLVTDLKADGSELYGKGLSQI